MISFRPTAVQGSPFAGHRTIAQIEADFDEAEYQQRQPAYRALTSVQNQILEKAQRSNLPPDPCFRCGDRGWCGHGGRVSQ